jgi:hypothetical protein
MDQAHIEWKIHSQVLVLFDGISKVNKVGFFTHFHKNRQKLQLSTPNLFA